MLRRIVSLALLTGIVACAHDPVPEGPSSLTPAVGASSEAPDVSGGFRVLTLNTAHGVVQPLLGPFLSREAVPRNLEAIARVLAREHADVVALQEVHREEGEAGLDHAARMAAAARYLHRFFGVHLPARARRAAHGTALLSRLALGTPTSHTFGLHPDDDKGYVLATVAPPSFGGVEVDVVSVHLDPFSEAKRIRQMDDMVRTLSGRGRPLVVMGDFNAGWGRAGGVQRLAQKLGLRAYQPGSGARTYPVFLPIGRIDWILIAPTLRFLSYRTFRDGVTDHAGVVADLGLAPCVLVRRPRALPVQPAHAAQ
jgi:endonuclease/exonuclease/phosphatase family metal-dependent hydrolase